MVINKTFCSLFIGFLLMCLLLTANVQASTNPRASTNSSSHQTSVLESYLHAYYQFNININLMWWDDSNLEFRRNTEDALPGMALAMKNILQDRKLKNMHELVEVQDNWLKAYDLLLNQGLLKSGYDDVSLIAAYRVAMDKVRMIIFDLYQRQPSSSDVIKTWILLDRVISTYVELNTDTFGSFIRSTYDQDSDINALVLLVDQQIEKLNQSNSLSAVERSSLSSKWFFIRPVLLGKSNQSLPFIVLINGRRMISILEKRIEL